MQPDLFEDLIASTDSRTPRSKKGARRGDRTSKAARDFPLFEPPDLVAAVSNMADAAGVGWDVAREGPAEPVRLEEPRAASAVAPGEGEATTSQAAAASPRPRRAAGTARSEPRSKSGGAAQLVPPPGLDPDVAGDLGLADEDVVPQVGTLADALAWYDDAVSIHPRRANIRSAFRALERVLGLPASGIPASPDKLRLLLQDASPSRVGMRPRTWVQYRSVALGALRALGVAVIAGRDSTPLAPEWAELLAGLSERKSQIGLSRLLRFFSRTGVAPQAVTPADFEAFRCELLTASLVPDVVGAYRQAVRFWNKAAADASGWPQVPVAAESGSRHYSFEWSRFPPSFVEEVEAFLASRANTDPLADDYVRSTRQATTENRRKMLRQIASALVLSGTVPLEAVTGLAVLVEIENVRRAISYLREERQGGEITASHEGLVWLLRTIAKHRLEGEAAAEAAKAIEALLTALRKHLSQGGARGLRPKNRERLRQFDIPQNVDALIGLPTRVLHSVRAAQEPTHRHSVRLMQALQVGILTFVPIRSKNLTELKLGTNLIDIRKGAKRSVRIRLAASETKTYRDYEAPVPAHLHPLLDLWLKEHRQRVCLADSPYFFPNPRGEQRSREALTSKLTAFIKREIGLEVNAHLFRHIAAKLYLDRDPSGIEIVRQFLAHTSSRTTLRVYAELQTDPAFRRLEEALLQVDYRPPPRRATLGAPPPQRRTR